MRKIIGIVFAICIVLGSDAQMVSMLGGGGNERAGKSKSGSYSMSPQKNIVENTAGSTEHSTLLMLLQSADLIETLSGPGPYTVFAPTNEAFSKIPQPVLSSLSDSENKKQLAKTLGFHVVAGKLDADALSKMIKEADGTATLTTLAGLTLTISKKGKRIILSDGKTVQATIIAADITQTNGVMHVVDKVLLVQ